MNKKSNYNQRAGLRGTALFVAFIFTVTSVSWNVPVASAALAPTTVAFTSLEKLVIPEAMGSISVTYRGERMEDGGGSQTKNLAPSALRSPPSEQFVVLIQDAHAVIDAQENIRKILALLGKDYGVALAALEGAHGRIEPVLFRTFPDPGVKQKILAGYEKRGELSGPEMAAVLQENGGDFRGMEDWPLYERNYAAYLEAQSKKTLLRERLDAVKKACDVERKAVYDPPLDEFQTMREDFRTDRASLLDLLLYLSHFSGLLKKSSGYQELPGLISSIGYEKTGKQEALAPMVREIANQFKEKYLRGLGVKTEMNFYNKYQSFMTGELPAGLMLQYLVQIGHECGKTIKLNPALKKMLGHTEVLSEIKGSLLADELDRFLLEAESSLIKSVEQRTLAEKYQKLFLMKDLIDLELSFADLATYEKDPSAYLELFGGTSGTQDLEPALSFYRSAVERDRAFVERIEIMLKETGRASVAVVAGGFHTRGIESLLRAKSVSYTIVTPKIASLEGQENYSRVMNGDVSYKAYLKTTYFDALMRHASKLLAEALPLPDRARMLKEWRDNLIRELAKEGRITEAGKYLPYIDEVLGSYVGALDEASSSKLSQLLVKTLQTELEKFKGAMLSRFWKTFEFQLRVLMDGLKQLVAQKELNPASASDLLDRVSRSKPSFLSQVKPLDPGIPIERRSESRLMGDSEASRPAPDLKVPAWLKEQSEQTVRTEEVTSHSKARRGGDEQRSGLFQKAIQTLFAPRRVDMPDTSSGFSPDWSPEEVAPPEGWERIREKPETVSQDLKALAPGTLVSFKGEGPYWYLAETLANDRVRLWISPQLNDWCFSGSAANLKSSLVRRAENPSKPESLVAVLDSAYFVSVPYFSEKTKSGEESPMKQSRVCQPRRIQVLTQAEREGALRSESRQEGQAEVSDESGQRVEAKSNDVSMSRRNFLVVGLFLPLLSSRVQRFSQELAQGSQRIETVFSKPGYDILLEPFGNDVWRSTQSSGSSYEYRLHEAETAEEISNSSYLWNGLLSLYESINPSANDFDAAHMGRLIDQTSGKIVMLLDGQRVAGFYRWKQGTLDMIAVGEKYRGTGAVDILLEDLKDRFLGGDPERTFQFEIVRDSLRAQKGIAVGTINDFRERSGIQSRVQIDWRHYGSRSESRAQSAAKAIVFAAIVGIASFVTQAEAGNASGTISREQIVTVQKALGVEQAGVIGPKTIAALQKKGNFQFKSGKFDPQTRAMFYWVLRENQISRAMAVPTASKVSAARAVAKAPVKPKPATVVSAVETGSVAAPAPVETPVVPEMTPQQLDELVGALSFLGLIKTDEEIDDVKNSETVRGIKIQILQRALDVPETKKYDDATRSEFAKLKASRSSEGKSLGLADSEMSKATLSVVVAKAGFEPVAVGHPELQALKVRPRVVSYFQKIYRGYGTYGYKLWPGEQKSVVTLWMATQMMKEGEASPELKKLREDIARENERRNLGQMRLGTANIEGGRTLAANQAGGPAASTEMLEPRSAIDAVFAAAASKDPNVRSVLYDNLSTEQASFIKSIVKARANNDKNQAIMSRLLQNSDFQDRLIILYFHHRYLRDGLSLPPANDLERQSGAYHKTWAPGIFEYPRTLGTFLYADTLYNTLEKLSRKESLTENDKKTLRQADGFSKSVEAVSIDMRQAHKAARKGDWGGASMFMAAAEKKYAKLLSGLNQFSLLPERFMITWKLRADLDQRNKRLRARELPQSLFGLPALTDLKSQGNVGMPLAISSLARSESRAEVPMRADASSRRAFLKMFLTVAAGVTVAGVAAGATERSRSLPVSEAKGVGLPEPSRADVFPKFKASHEVLWDAAVAKKSPDDIGKSFGDEEAARRARLVDAYVRSNWTSIKANIQDPFILKSPSNGKDRPDVQQQALWLVRAADMASTEDAPIKGLFSNVKKRDTVIIQSKWVEGGAWTSGSSWRGARGTPTIKYDEKFNSPYLLAEFLAHEFAHARDVPVGRWDAWIELHRGFGDFLRGVGYKEQRGFEAQHAFAKTLLNVVPVGGISFGNPDMLKAFYRGQSIVTGMLSLIPIGLELSVVLGGLSLLVDRKEKRAEAIRRSSASPADEAVRPRSEIRGDRDGMEAVSAKEMGRFNRAFEDYVDTIETVQIIPNYATRLAIDDAFRAAMEELMVPAYDALAEALFDSGILGRVRSRLVYPFMGPDLVPALYRKTHHINWHARDVELGKLVLERTLKDPEAADKAIANLEIDPKIELNATDPRNYEFLKEKDRPPYTLVLKGFSFYGGQIADREDTLKIILGYLQPQDRILVLTKSDVELLERMRIPILDQLELYEGGPMAALEGGPPEQKKVLLMPDRLGVLRKNETGDFISVPLAGALALKALRVAKKSKNWLSLTVQDVNDIAQKYGFRQYPQDELSLDALSVVLNRTDPESNLKATGFYISERFRSVPVTPSELVSRILRHEVVFNEDEDYLCFEPRSESRGALKPLVLSLNAAEQQLLGVKAVTYNPGIFPNGETGEIFQLNSPDVFKYAASVAEYIGMHAGEFAAVSDLRVLQVGPASGTASLAALNALLKVPGAQTVMYDLVDKDAPSIENTRLNFENFFLENNIPFDYDPENNTFRFKNDGKAVTVRLFARNFLEFDEPGTYHLVHFDAPVPGDIESGEPENEEFATLLDKDIYKAIVAAMAARIGATGRMLLGGFGSLMDGSDAELFSSALPGNIRWNLPDLLGNKILGEDPVRVVYEILPLGVAPTVDIEALFEKLKMDPRDWEARGASKLTDAELGKALHDFFLPNDSIVPLNDPSLLNLDRKQFLDAFWAHFISTTFTGGVLSDEAAHYLKYASGDGATMMRPILGAGYDAQQKKIQSLFSAMASRKAPKRSEMREAVFPEARGEAFPDWMAKAGKSALEQIRNSPGRTMKGAFMEVLEQPPASRSQALSNYPVFRETLERGAPPVWEHMSPAARPLHDGAVFEALKNAPELKSMDDAQSHQFLQLLQLYHLYLQDYTNASFPFTFSMQSVLDGQKRPVLFYRDVPDVKPGFNLTQVMIINGMVTSGKAVLDGADVTEFYFLNGVYVGYGVTRVPVSDLSKLEMQYQIFPQTEHPDYGRVLDHPQMEGIPSEIYNQRLDLWRKLIPDGQTCEITVPAHQLGGHTTPENPPSFYLDRVKPRFVPLLGASADGKPRYDGGLVLYLKGTGGRSETRSLEDAEVRALLFKAEEGLVWKYKTKTIVIGAKEGQDREYETTHIDDESDPARNVLSSREVANLGILNLLMLRGEISQRDFYRLMQEAVDPKVKVLVDLGEDRGGAVLRRFQKRLGDRFVPLLVEPGISTRAVDFIDFAMGLLAGDPKLTPNEIRNRYEEHLGKTKVYRGMYVREDQVDHIRRNGLINLDAEKADIGSLDLNVITDRYRELLRAGDMAPVWREDANSPSRRFYYFGADLREGFEARAQEKVSAGSSSLVSVTRIRELALALLSPDEEVLASAAYNNRGSRPYLFEYEVPAIYLLDAPYIEDNRGRDGMRFPRRLRIEPGAKIYNQTDRSAGVEIFSEVLLSPEWLVSSATRDEIMETEGIPDYRHVSLTNERGFFETDSFEPKTWAPVKMPAEEREAVNTLRAVASASPESFNADTFFDELLAFDPVFETELIEPVGVSQGYALEGHLRRVLEEDQKMSGDLAGQSRTFWRLLIAVHDLGKPEAVRKGDKRLQHTETLRILEERGLLDRWGLSEKEKRVLLALIRHDPIGVMLTKSTYRQNQDDHFNEAYSVVLTQIEEAGIPAADFFDALIRFYSIDARSYPELSDFAFDKQGNIRSPLVNRLRERVTEAASAKEPSAQSGSSDAARADQETKSVRLAGRVEVDPVETVKMEPEKMRSEMRALGEAELKKLEGEFDQGIKTVLELVLEEKTPAAIRRYVAEDAFEAAMLKEFEPRLKPFVGDDSAKEVKASVATIRQAFAAIEVSGVEFGIEGFVDAGGVQPDAVARTLALLNATNEAMQGRAKEHSIEVVTNHSGHDNEAVLKTLEALTLARLILLHRKDQPVGRAFNIPGVPLTSIVYDQANADRTAEKQVSKIATHGDTVALWTEDLHTGRAGMYTIIAEIGRIADPELKALACAAIQHILLKYASATAAERKAFETTPKRILQDLEKMGFGSVIKFKGSVLVFDMQAFADMFAAKQSIEQAA